MATENLQIADILANQNQKEVTANAASNLLDRAMNGDGNYQKTITGSTSFSTAETRENPVAELVGTPGTAFTVNMPDTNRRWFAVKNSTDGQATIRNSAGAGTGQPVIAIGAAAIFYYDGTNFIDITSFMAAGTNFTELSDTPSAYTNESGQILRVNGAESALEFTYTVVKDPVRVATVANGTLATAFENGDTVDGVTLNTGDRILLKDQSTGAENGVYIVQATGAPVRADDFDDDADVTGGILVPVLEGDVNGLDVFMLSNTGAITVGTTALTFRNLTPTLATQYVPASEMYDGGVGTPALNRVNLTTGNPVINSWDLDQTVDEAIQFSLVMPLDWDLSTIEVDIYWSHTTGGTLFDVVLGVAAVSVADDGAQDVAFGTQQTVTDSGGTADDLYIAAITGITVGGTPAEGKLVHFEIERLATNGSDDLDLDARIQGALIRYTRK